MIPEVKVLCVVASTMGLAYLAVYPKLRRKSLRRMMMVDIVLSVALLVVIGGVYSGSGIRFSLLGLSMPWWLYTLIVAAAVELPLFIWFCQRHDVDFDD